MKDWSIWLAAGWRCCRAVDSTTLASAGTEVDAKQHWGGGQKWGPNTNGQCVDTNQMANMYVCHNCSQQQWTKVTTILCCRYAFDFQQQEKFLENRTRVGQKRGRDTTNIKWSKCMCAIMEVHHSGQKWPTCNFPCALQCCGRVRQREILLSNPGQAI